MSILVVCPGCHKSFQVGDQYAGKKGPCPNCKRILVVPQKSEEVKVHGAEAFASGGRTKEGKLATKPVGREEARVDPLVVGAVVGGSLAVLIAAWVAGAALASNLVFRVVGLLAVGPPLAVGAYTFLRNDELEPYRGVELWVRAAICGAAYAALWGAYAYLAWAIFSSPPELWQWLVVLPPLFVAGGMIAGACFDLEFGNGFFHYVFYFLVIVILRWVAGMGWLWAPTSPTGMP